ncbi:hypothetical protein COCC4DRAFT_130484, partial [Bipolaris maydis ATCC 48331]
DGTSRDLEPRDSHPVHWDPEWLPNYSLSDPGRGSFLLLLVTADSVQEKQSNLRRVAPSHQKPLN